MKHMRYFIHLKLANDSLLAWLSVCSEVQMICMWSS